jgi:peptide/nickel transport system substrate-binding protein
MERRSLLKGAAGSALAVSTAGLSGMARAQQGKKILVIASGQDIPNFDPHVATGYSASMLLRNTYDGLVRVEGNPPKVMPHLAASWTVSPNGLEYVFKLDTAARFQDGTPVTANAVAYSFRRTLRLAKGNAWMIAGVVDPNGIEATDVQTVKFKLLKPFAPFLSVLPWQFIVNPVLVETNKGADDGQEYLRKNLAGSGRFKIKRAEQGNLYEFERVAQPWKPGGNLDGAIWKIVRETSSQRLMLARGEAHIAVDLTSEDMDALKDRPGVVRILEPEFRTFSIKMNTQNGPLADVNLRKAVSHAFNYKGMMDAAGYAELMVGPLPPGLMSDPKLKVPRTDLEAAKAFMAKSKIRQRWRQADHGACDRPGAAAAMGAGAAGQPQEDWNRARHQAHGLAGHGGLHQDAGHHGRFLPGVPDRQLRRPGQRGLRGLPTARATATGRTRCTRTRRSMHSSSRAVARLIRRSAPRSTTSSRRPVVDDAPDIFGVLEKRRIAMRDTVQGFSFTPVASNAIDLQKLSLK